MSGDIQKIPATSSLEEALAACEIELASATRRKLKRWCELMWDANQRINLTRHTDWSTFVARDLTDVLQLSNLLDENLEVLDIGSGGGVPGLVLAIVRPDLKVTVCDSVRKKANVLKSLCEALQLPVAVFPERAEAVLADLGFDCCTARAVGPIWKLLTWLNGHWADARKLYTFKGPRWREELAEAKQRGLTKRLLATAVARYPLHSTDADAPPIESVIVRLMRDPG
jgi:16S rRNA (guanine527-N7)-methyltransferase